MQNRCWYRIPQMRVGDAISSGWGFPKIEIETMIIFPDIVPINPIWYHYMLDTWGLRVWHTILFYRPAHYIDDHGHVDLDIEDKTKLLDAIVINWVWGGQRSEMVWYEMPDRPSPIKQYEHSSIGDVVYQGWPIPELKECDRANIGRIPTLTRVDLPHNVDMHQQPRWGLSIRFHPLGHTSWADTVQDFQARGWINSD
jgi:hypothetical protein